jgi:hypothetical protein
MLSCLLLLIKGESMIHATKIYDKIQIVITWWGRGEGLIRKFMPVRKKVGKNLPVVILVVGAGAAF